MARQLRGAGGPPQPWPVGQLRDGRLRLAQPLTPATRAGRAIAQSSRHRETALDELTRHEELVRAYERAAIDGFLASGRGGVSLEVMAGDDDATVGLGYVPLDQAPEAWQAPMLSYDPQRQCVLLVRWLDPEAGTATATYRTVTFGWAEAEDARAAAIARTEEGDD